MSFLDRFRRLSHARIEHGTVPSPSTDAPVQANGGATWNGLGSVHKGGEGTTGSAPSAVHSLPDPRAAYGFGLEDGRKQVDPDHFTQYLQRSAEEEEIDARLATLQQREKDIRDELAAVRERRESVARLQVEVEHLDTRTEEIKEELQRVERDLETARRDYEGVRHLGLLGYVWIYGAAALAFVLADVVITRAIVADALELTGNTMLGIDEAWYFAIALALIAVLLKPAYDRLVEEPYWEGKRRTFNVTIIIASSLALATLFVLGAFRNVAFRSQTEQDFYRDTMEGNSVELLQKLTELQLQVVNNAWGEVAFIMSGVLFAIAGAVCLGIGLRHFHDFRNVRWPARRRHKSLDRIHRRLRDVHTEKLMERTAATAALRRTEVWLDNRPGLDELEERLASVRTEQGDLLTRRSEIRKERLSRLYADGYAMGKRLGDRPQVKSPASPQRKRPRPYVAIRRAIRTTLPDNHHNTTSNV